VDDVSITLALSWPVSVNALYRATGGRNQLAKPARIWYAAAIEKIKNHPGYRAPLFPPEARLEVRLLLVPRTARAFDVDNFCKAVYDALEKSELIGNDSQIFEASQVKVDRPGDLTPGAYLRVTEATGYPSLWSAELFNLAGRVQPW